MNNEIRIYQHSDLIYWWPVSLCGFICAYLTNQDKKMVLVGGHTEVAFYQDTLLGLSFIAVVLMFLMIIWEPRRIAIFASWPPAARHEVQKPI